MALRSQSTYDLLRQHGVDRRTFLEYCVKLTASMGLGMALIPKVVSALETKPRLPVIWLHGLECTCCSESFIRSSHPIAQDIVLNMISLDYDDTLAGNARPGDRVIVSGTLGDHGITIMSQREGIGFDSEIASDSAALHTLVRAMLDASGELPGAIRCLRDPTRGGLASSLNEIAERSGVGMELVEAGIPIREEVRGACEMLGLDPLYLANEGKLVAIVTPQAADAILAAMQAHPLGREARVIGTVAGDHPGLVTARTAFGTTRIVDMLAGDQLPRIC